jgi:hypothetical protein
MLKLLSVLIVEEDALKIKPSKDSQSEILLINHQKKIYKKIEPLNSMLFLNCILKCNTVSGALFTPELLKSDPLKTEESEHHLKEYKETHQEKLSKVKENEIFFIKFLILFY